MSSGITNPAAQRQGWDYSPSILSFTPDTNRSRLPFIPRAQCPSSLSFNFLSCKLDVEKKRTLEVLRAPLPSQRGEGLHGPGSWSKSFFWTPPSPHLPKPYPCFPKRGFRLEQQAWKRGPGQEAPIGVLQGYRPSSYLLWALDSPL